jgi:hypothetical protein
MEKFKNNIYNIYNLINEEDSKSLIDTKTVSKQYLAYYIYRIITKYIKLIEISTSSEDIEYVMKLLRIPIEHNRELNYPMAGKLTNENDILDMIILGGIDMFEKVNNYLNTLDKKNKQKKYQEFFKFLKEKDLNVILKDLMNLQKLIPGLSVPIIRPHLLSNNKI